MTLKIVIEYAQEIPQSQTTDKPKAQLTWNPSNSYNVSSWRKILIKLTHYDETKKRAHDSQIVRAKENLKLSHDGSSYR